jgi:shikimate dehydrogenase
LWVADAIYFPLLMPLLMAAKARGARIMTGRGLAIFQAADAFELFTGLSPPMIEMENAFDDAIGKVRTA